MNSLIRLIAAGLCMAVVAPALAEPKPEDVVRYRRGVMMAIGWNVGAMGAMAKGEMDWDGDRFAFWAERAAVLAPMAMEGFTPATAEAESNALPAVWSNMDDFEKRMLQMEEATAKLAEVARGGDKGATLEQFGAAAKNCKGCHDEYKKKE
ncbi:MAG: c-type cytochrome [Gammaproteobacteria bacterium]